MYFVRRGDQIKGPLSQDRLRRLHDESRLSRRDEIATTPEGPWRRFAECSAEVLGVAEEDDQGDGFDEFFSGLDGRGDARGTAAGRSRPGGQPATVKAPAGFVAADRLLRHPHLVWIAIGGTAIVSALAAVGLAAALGVFSPAQQEQIAREATAEINAARPTPPLPRAESPPAARGGDAGNTDRRSTSRPPARPAAAVADDPVPAEPPAVVEKSVDPAVEQAAEITRLLESYYKAADWASRYRSAVPGEQSKGLMKLLYADIDWVAVQWNVSRMPPQEELVAAARARKPVRIDTVLDGNPHQIFVVWVDGRWRIDWLHSLETLWLTK